MLYRIALLHSISRNSIHFFKSICKLFFQRMFLLIANFFLNWWEFVVKQSHDVICKRVSSDLLNFVVYTYCVEVFNFFKYDNTGKCIYVCIKHLVLFEAYSWSEWTYLIIFVTYISKLCIFILIREFIYFIKQYVTIFHKCLLVSNLGDEISLNC